MIAWRYDRLTEITNNLSPFRGTPNRFPWDSRRRSEKCIYVRKEGEDTVFDISYGHEHDTEVISKEAYHSYVASGQSQYVRLYRDFYVNKDVYVYMTKRPAMLGTVRPDNTFEFTNDTYGQGDRIMLSNHSNGYFNVNSRLGGLVYTQGHALMPIYKGMRVDCGTMRPTEDFSVFVKNVDRSKSKNLLKNYEKFFKVSETMFKAIDHATFKASAREIITNIDDYISRWGRCGELIDKGYELIEESPFDAMTYMIAGLNTNYCLASLSEQSTLGSWGGRRSDPHYLFMSAKKSIMKEIYKRNPIFSEREFTAGNVYPASTWGIILRVNGKEVEQCY